MFSTSKYTINNFIVCSSVIVIYSYFLGKLANVYMIYAASMQWHILFYLVGIILQHSTQTLYMYIWMIFPQITELAGYTSRVADMLDVFQDMKRGHYKRHIVASKHNKHLKLEGPLDMRG